VELDLVTRWTLYFFGSLLAGGVVGFLIARLATFELGMGIGLLVPGVVSLSFVVPFVAGYRAFAYDPARTAGVVVAVEDRAANPSSSITSPVAIVEYATRDGIRERVDGPRSSSLKDGDDVVVVPRPGMPRAPRIGRPSDMRGGAIAALLFGTFPFSAGVFFLASALVAERSFEDEQRAVERQERSYLTMAANLFMVCGILATPFFSEPIESGRDRGVAHAIMLGFGVVAIGLWIHVVHGALARRDVRWTLGVAVVAINFSAWVVALWFLTDPRAGW
jgi:hypothetical protein